MSPESVNNEGQVSNSQLPKGVVVDNFGGITSVGLLGDIWQERLYEYVGREDYVANYTLKPESEAFKKYGADFTATIAYTLKEREIFEQTYLSGSKDIWQSAI